MDSKVSISWTAGNATTPLNIVANSMPEPSDPETVYMYLDESGNFDFGPNGSEYFIMTCVVMHRTFNLAHVVFDYRYDCLEGGVQIEKFHACEDVRDVRLGMYSRIVAFGNDMKAYSISVRKSQIPEPMRKASTLYSEVFSWIVEEVYKNECSRATKRAIVVTDSLPKQALQKDVDGPLKTFMKRIFQNNGIPYSLMHHCSSCDPNLQIADYFCWAVHRKLVKGHDWPYTLVAHLVKENGEAEINESGDE